MRGDFGIGYAIVQLLIELVARHVRIEFLGRKLKKDRPAGSTKNADYFNNWEVKDIPAKAIKPEFQGSEEESHEEAHSAPRATPLNVPAAVHANVVAAPEDDGLPF